LPAERIVLAALFAVCQAAALGRLLVAASLLSPDGLVTLRVATVFQTYTLYLMLGVPEILYLSFARWQRERGTEAAAQLSGFAFTTAVAAALAGGIGAAVVLASIYNTPIAVAVAAAVFTAGASMQIGFMSPSYLAQGQLIPRAAREVVAAVAGLAAVWFLGATWGLPGVIFGMAAGYWIAAATSWGAWRGIRPHMSRTLAREVVPSGAAQVSIQVGLMVLASTDIVLLSQWRQGDPELPLYVMAVAVLTAVSGAAQAIAGPAIVNLIQSKEENTRSAGALSRAVLAEASQVSCLLALAAAAAAIGMTLVLPQYAGMHRWLPAVAVTCLASRIAYFPTLHLIVSERRRVVIGSAAGAIAFLLALLYGLGQAVAAPTIVVLWSSALATFAYATTLVTIVLGRRLSTPVMATLAVFTVLMLGDAFATFRGWFDMRTSVANLVFVSLGASLVFLRLRGSLEGPLSWGSFSLRNDSNLEHAIPPSSK
jgi:hypothetical protein